MATTAPLIRAAIETAVKGIAPTLRADEGRFRLLEGDEEPAEFAANSGAIRRFMVTYEKGEEGPYQAFTDGEIRRRFFISIVYPSQRALNTALRDLIESDLHDLRVTLNDYLVWGSALADSTALLHAMVQEWDQPPAVVAGRLVLLVPLDVQYLETVI